MPQTFLGTLLRQPMPFYSLTWKQIELNGQKPRRLTGYVGHMHKDILVTISLLPHVLLLKNQKLLATKLGLTVISFRKGIVNIPPTTKLLVLSSDMCVKIVMEPIYQEIVLRRIVQKTRLSK